MVQGVKGSKLLSDMYEGDDRNVPIGKRILVNDQKALSDNLKPLTTGRQLTSLHVDQFDVFGRSRDGKAIKRDPNGNNVTYQDRTVLNDGLIVEAALDKEDGVLNLVKKNSQVLTISGFLTQSDFGRGATGPRGENGFDGNDGYDGDDGSDGIVGCEGPQGTMGPQGERGAAGKDGRPGVPGPMGQEGLTGLEGPAGYQGRYGHEGARGRKGASCNSEAGADGAAGVSLNSNVVITPDSPDSTVVLWGVPT